MGLSHLTDYNETQRADYMVIVASLALADGEVSSEEIFAIRQLCNEFVLGPEARGRVMAASVAPIEDNEEILRGLAKTSLRHSLILDLCTMAYRDGKLDESEEAEIHRVARSLAVESAQAAAMLTLAGALSGKGDVGDALKAVQKSGVEDSAIAISATMMGLGRNGDKPIQEALEALRKG